ncbi:MAG: FAD-dependent oxidoreductase [Planctomycetota bacterium]
MIKRRDFISVCSALGILGCQSYANTSRFNGSVTIIGAGVAGMAVGHLLSQRGIDFTIVEAAPSYGGRVKTLHDFVDFPVPLGGEWLHVDEHVLRQIVNDDSVEVATELAAYESQSSYGFYSNGRLQVDPIGDDLDEFSDKKFINGTWLTFFEQYVLPGIRPQMRFDSVVTSIDYSKNNVSVSLADGGELESDAVVVTVPPQVIRDGDIEFTPQLPKRKQNAFRDASIWGGMKVFIEFKEKFYPTYLEIARTNSPRGQKLYYDAAYGQKSLANVLGIFLVGDPANPYQSRTGDALRDYVLDELDAIFDDVASRSYLKHVAQDWNKQKFIRQAYYADSADWRLPPRMQSSLGRKVFFAGDTYTDGEDWGSVHAAANSAREAVEALLG